MVFDAHHCAVNVADTDEALAFYRDELGLDVVRQWQAGELQGTLDGLAGRDDFDVAETAAGVTYLSAGDFYLELVEYRNPPGDDANELLGNDSVGRIHVCFTVSDMRSTYQSLSERVDFVSRPIMTTAGGLMVKCYDPSGTLVELMEPPDADGRVAAAGGSEGRVVTGLHHYGVNTNDVEAAIEFYRETFGWELLTRYAPPPAVDEYASGLEPGRGVTELAFVDAGGCEIELLEYADAENENGSIDEFDVGRPHLGIRVDDSEAVYGTLSDAVTFLSEPQSTERGAVVTKCRGYEGYTLEFIEPPTWLP